MFSSWTSSVHPRLNGQIGLELAFSPNSLRTKIEAGLDKIKKVTISQSGAFDFSGSDKKVNGMIKFELPYKVIISPLDFFLTYNGGPVKIVYAVFEIEKTIL